MSTQAENPADPSLDRPEAADDPEARSVAFTRRELLRAGWTVPVVMAVAAATPKAAFAASQSRHGDHNDGWHEDWHWDNHGDYSDHTDNISHGDAHGDHNDNVVHLDVSGIRATFSLPGYQEHVDTHQDTPGR